MKQDRFWLGILAAIGLLVVVSLTIFFLRQGKEVYLPDDAPEGVAHNYVLALQQGDYERAYGYLADKEGKPSYEQFRQAFLSSQSEIRGTGVQIGDADLSDEAAYIEVTVVRASGGPFFDESRFTEAAILVKQNGGWRISQMPYPYWAWDWYQAVPE